MKPCLQKYSVNVTETHLPGAATAIRLEQLNVKSRRDTPYYSCYHGGKKKTKPFLQRLLFFCLLSMKVITGCVLIKSGTLSGQ